MEHMTQTQDKWKEVENDKKKNIFSLKIKWNKIENYITEGEKNRTAKWITIRGLNEVKQ